MVLVTGATGFIGGKLVERNIAAGKKVRAFVLPGDPGAEDLKNLGAEIYTGDIRDYNAVREAVRGADIVFHCAAVVTDWAPKALFQEVTVGGSENICRASAEEKVSRFVDISTNDVFGRSEKKVLDESCELHIWKEPYPDYKITAEIISWKYYFHHKLPVTMVYPCWVYGEGDKTFVPLLAEAIMEGDMLFWRKNVLVWPTYIENLVDLLMLISEDERAVGNGYLVHDGESVTLQEFCAEIARTLGKKPPKVRIPYFAAYLAAVFLEMIWKMFRRETRPLLTTYTVKNLGSRLRFTIGKAERELGWKPKISYKEGMARTMEWLKGLDIKTYVEK